MIANEELRKARKEAVSIGAYNEPDRPELLGIVEEGILGKVYYYKDKTGRYFYQSERTMQVEKEMQERQKKKRSYIKKETSGKTA